MANSVLVRQGWRSAALVALLLAPALGLYALFVVIPLLQSIYFSLFKWGGLGPLVDFIGLNNYQQVVHDGVFLQAAGHNLSVVAVSIFVQLPLALAIATLLTGKFKGRAVFRVVFFVPYVVSEVVAAVLWKLLLSPEGGINTVLADIGLNSLAQPWLAQPQTVMGAVLFVVVWKFFGSYVILFLAALQAVPKEHIEAAVLDGANSWQTFRYVTLPAIGPTVRITVFLALIGSLQLFDVVWVMTQGGPVGASSTVVTYMINQGFQSYRYGYASAVSVLIAIASFVIAAMYQRFVLARDNRSDLREERVL